MSRDFIGSHPGRSFKKSPNRDRLTRSAFQQPEGAYTVTLTNIAQSLSDWKLIRTASIDELNTKLEQARQHLYALEFPTLQIGEIPFPSDFPTTKIPVQKTVNRRWNHLDETSVEQQSAGFFTGDGVSALSSFQVKPDNTSEWIFQFTKTRLIFREKAFAKACVTLGSEYISRADYPGGPLPEYPYVIPGFDSLDLSCEDSNVTGSKSEPEYSIQLPFLIVDVMPPKLTITEEIRYLMIQPQPAFIIPRLNLTKRRVVFGKWNGADYPIVSVHPFAMTVPGCCFI